MISFKHRIIKSLCIVFASLMVLFAFTACSETDKAKADYWFNDYKRTEIKYDETTDNLNTAGMYWEFSAKKDYGYVVMNVRIGNLDWLSSVHLYVNGVEKTAESNTNSIYDGSYVFDFKKGDTVKIHAKYESSAVEKQPFSMAVFSMYLESNGNEYLIELD